MATPRRPATRAMPGPSAPRDASEAISDAHFVLAGFLFQKRASQSHSRSLLGQAHQAPPQRPRCRHASNLLLARLFCARCLNPPDMEMKLQAQDPEPGPCGVASPVVDILPFGSRLNATLLRRRGVSNAHFGDPPRPLAGRGDRCRRTLLRPPHALSVASVSARLDGATACAPTTTIYGHRPPRDQSSRAACPAPGRRSAPACIGPDGKMDTRLQSMQHARLRPGSARELHRASTKRCHAATGI